MYGYLIYGSCDGFGNDVYVVEPKVFTSFEKACEVATKWNRKAEGIDFNDEWRETYEEYKNLSEEDFDYLDSVPYYTPVRITIE